MNIIFITSFLTLFDFIAAVCQENLSITEQAILDYHNHLRRLHLDTPDICYGMSDTTHSFYPQEWSENLLPRGPKNAGHSNEKGLVGENIAWNPKVVHPVEDYLIGIKKWYDEIFQYQFGDNGKRNKKRNIGHVTQLLWKDTKELRCGRAAGKGEEGVFIVCHYWPKGNIGSLLATEFKPFKDKNQIRIPNFSGEIMEKIVKSARLEMKNGEEMPEPKKRPEESGNSHADMIVIIFVTSLPCIFVFGIVFCWRKMKTGKAQYHPLLQEDHKSGDHKVIRVAEAPKR